ncbi:UNVERIFIED_CONTAM: hypothetical protein FKN15_078543 [Acipenser sinensis]
MGIRLLLHSSVIQSRFYCYQLDQPPVCLANKLRQRVRDKIERDKAERAMKFGGGCSRAAPVTPPVEAPPTFPPTSQGPPPAKREYDECRIQVRLLDGSALTSAFKAREPLAAVRLYVELNRTDGAEEFTLLTPFPRRQFTEEDMETPLQELGEEHTERENERETERLRHRERV